MKSINRLIIIALALFIQSCLPADEDPVTISPISGDVVRPDVGGAAQPNQVWIDLSEKKSFANKRTDWDLAFYSGEEFRVLINYSAIMAVAKIPNATDINAVKESDVAVLMDKVMVGPYDPAAINYIDDPSGNFLQQTRGITEIKENDAENAVYLVNMGREIYNQDIAPGSSISGGESRGWKKIQINRATNGYKIKFANLNDTTHTEFIITKNTDYHFSFFSMVNNKLVDVQPKKKNWDIVFTIFTNDAYNNDGSLAGTYIFNDFVLTNILGNVGAYQVNIPNGQNQDAFYNNFKLKDIDATKFIFNDQRAIGDHWRTVTGNNGAQVYANRFYIIKDADGFFFKLRFNKMMKDGIRGNPEFEYEPL